MEEQEPRVDRDSQKRAYIAGLIQEREGYVRRADGATDDEERAKYDARVKAVDGELRRMGAVGKIPKEQAERRPATPVEKR
jgi:hypothetical protein